MNLIISTDNKTNDSIIKSIHYKSFLNNEKEIINEIKFISKEIALTGFINNNYILNSKDSTYYCLFQFNKRIDSITINYDNKFLKKGVVNKLSKNYNDSTFTVSTKKIETTLNYITTYFENNGYSFIDIQLIKLQLNKGSLKAKLIIKTPLKRHIDKVVIKGYENFPKKYLKQYLGLKPSKEFKLKTLETINKKLKAIPFISILKKPEVLFTIDSTFLYLYINKKATNNFDGIISISNNETNNKLQLNGYIDFLLNNILNKGESFNIQYKNYDDSKILYLNSSIPYIFGSKFETNFNLSIFKQDSSYINTSSKFKLNYSLNSKNFISISSENIKSNLVESSSSISNLNNFSTNFTGFTYTYNPFFSVNEDTTHNLKFEISLLTGNRKIDEVKNKQTKIETSIFYKYKLNNSNYIFLKNTFKKFNSKNILDNELYRIGGINSIRGFNELSILTSRFNVTNLELQHILNNKLTIYTITDLSVLKDENLSENTTLYGIGLGLNITSSNSILSLNYALGKTNNTSFNLRNGMVHFKISYPF